MDKEDYYPIISSDSGDSLDKKLENINYQNNAVNKELDNKPKTQEMKEKEEEPCCVTCCSSCMDLCLPCGFLCFILGQR